MNNLKYRMIIEWSDEDDCFLVALPDFPGQIWRTHGESYEEGAANGKEVLESLIISYQSEGEPLPEPSIVRKVKNSSELGKRLRQIRKEIIAEGIPLLNVEKVEKEKAERRGGYQGDNE